MYFLAYIWFPDFYFLSDGGWEGVRIIFLVDIVLGPILTLIIYKPGKKGLLFDLIIIGLVQAICLTIGTKIVYDRRPAVLLYADRAFFTISYDFYKSQNIDTSFIEKYGSIIPLELFANTPEDPSEKLAYMRTLNQTNETLRTRTDNYVPLNSNFSRILDNSTTASKEYFISKGYVEEINAWFKNQPEANPTNVFFIPLISTYKQFYIGMNKSTGYLYSTPLKIKPSFYDEISNKQEHQ